MRGALPNGERIRAARLDRGLTQEELANLADCDVKTIRNAERGRRVDASTVKRIADALGQTLSAIAAPQDGSPQATQRNIDLFWIWQNASNARDIEGMVNCYHPKAVVLIPGAQDLPGGGEFRGLDAIRAQWTQSMDAFDTEELTPDRVQVDAVGDYLFARATATAVVRATGLSFTAMAIQEFVMKDGKILRHTIAVDTAGVRRSMPGEQ